MSLNLSAREWLKLPSRIALLLGLSAVSVTGPRADTTGSHDNGMVFGDLRIRLDGGQVYISEPDGRYRQLRDSAETRVLVQLLERGIPASSEAQPRPVKLAGSGGSGFHWAPAGKADSRDNPSSIKSKSHAPTSLQPTGQKTGPPKTTPDGNGPKG